MVQALKFPPRLLLCNFARALVFKAQRGHGTGRANKENIPASNPESQSDTANSLVCCALEHRGL